jgi:hypothetical protein
MSPKGDLLHCGRSLICMSHAYTVFGIFCAALLIGLATGCERDGPAERAGEKLDRAVKDAGDALKGRK